jgi:phage-related protein
MADFPTLSTKEDSRHFKVTQEDTAMRTNMEGGYVVTRPRHTRAPRKTYTTGFTDISGVDAQTLLDFWDQVRGGSEAFYYTHPISQQRILVRFAKEIDFKYVGMGETPLWNATNITLEEV